MGTANELEYLGDAAVKYVLDRNVWNRWIIVHPEHRHLAWSGSQWVPHVRGVGTIAQISNFDTRDEADDAARRQVG